MELNQEEWTLLCSVTMAGIDLQKFSSVQAHLFPWHGWLPTGYSDTLSAFIEGRGWGSLFAAGLEGARIEVFAVWCQLTQDV